MNKKEEKWRMEGASYVLRNVKTNELIVWIQDLKMRGS